MDVFKVADILVDFVKAKYAGDIAIVACYGSYIRGTARKDSDLDMFFIPSTAKGYQASFQFILEGIGFDFWPIGWERAENMASFNESKASLIADSQVIYSRTQEDLNRFEGLRARIDEMRGPACEPLMLGKAMREFKDCSLFLFNMSLPQVKQDLPAVRMEANKLISHLADCWAYLNQKYLSGGWPQSRNEVLALARKPAGSEKLLEEATSGDNAEGIVRACRELVLQTRALLVELQKGYSFPTEHNNVMKGFYEEIKSTFNKIVAACDANDARTAGAAALSAQMEISLALAQAGGKGEFSEFNVKDEIGAAYAALNLPDLAREVDSNDLGALRAAVLDLDRKLKRALEERGVKIEEFASLDEFAAFMKKRK